MGYRFSQNEIQGMKNEITFHVGIDQDAKRLRLYLEMCAYCTGGKVNPKKYARKLDLYNRLTINDKPNF